MYKLEEQERVIELFDNYYAIVSEVKHKSFHGKGLKTLTPNQVLKGLLIVLTQVTAGIQ